MSQLDLKKLEAQIIALPDTGPDPKQSETKKPDPLPLKEAPFPTTAETDTEKAVDPPLSPTIIEKFAKKMGYVKSNAKSGFKIQIKKEISTGTFIAFCCTMAYLFLVNFPITWWDFQDSAFSFIFWFILSAIFIVIGVQGITAFSFVLNIYKIMTNEQLSIFERFNLLMATIQQWLGIAANLSEQCAKELANTAKGDK